MALDTAIFAGGCFWCMNKPYIYKAFYISRSRLILFLKFAYGKVMGKISKFNQ